MPAQAPRSSGVELFWYPSLLVCGKQVNAYALGCGQDCRPRGQAGTFPRIRSTLRRRQLCRRQAAPDQHVGAEIRAARPHQRSCLHPKPRNRSGPLRISAKTGPMRYSSRSRSIARPSVSLSRTKVMPLLFSSSGSIADAGFPAERPTGTRPASGSSMDPPPLNSARRLAAIDADDLAFAREFHGSQKIRNQRKQIRKPIRLGAQDQDGNVPTRKVLLVWQPFSMVTKDLPAGYSSKRIHFAGKSSRCAPWGRLPSDTGLLSQDRVAGSPVE